MPAGRKPLEIAGAKFGKLTVLSDTGKRRSNYVVWNCRCDCGRTTEKSTQYLKATSFLHCCGYCRIQGRDLTDQKFGMLTARRITNERRGKSRVWLCDCECGRTKPASVANLTNPAVQHHCGCNKQYKRKPSTRGKHLSPDHQQRRSRMVMMLSRGVSKTEIAKEYNLSRERVGQILATLGR